MKRYSEYLSEIFPGSKIQKISVNAGFSCPNRDGTVGYGGCIYCRNDSFTPSYCHSGETVTRQIEQGKLFFSRKYPRMKYIAYFQSYTNTHSGDIRHLESIYLEAARCPGIVGLAIGTRPDTLPPGVISLLSSISKTSPVFLEIGAETSHDRTLETINRGHTWQEVENSVRHAAEAGIHTGLHLIAGLPGETESDILETVRKACLLPIETLKIHQLQILKGTPLHEKWIKGNISVHPYNCGEYMDLCLKIAHMVPDRIAIERFTAQSPPELVVAPQWGMKNHQFMDQLMNKLNKPSL